MISIILFTLVAFMLWKMWMLISFDNRATDLVIYKCDASTSLKEIDEWDSIYNRLRNSYPSTWRYFFSVRTPSYFVDKEALALLES